MTGWIVSASSTSFYDDLICETSGEADIIYARLVQKAHSSLTITKLRPDLTVEKSQTGTGNFRPR